VVTAVYLLGISNEIMAAVSAQANESIAINRHRFMSSFNDSPSGRYFGSSF